MRQVFPDGLNTPCHYHSPICLIVGMIITLINFLVMTITLINVIVMSHDHHTNKRHSQDHHTDKHHSHDHHRHLEHKFLPRSWRWLGNEAFIRKTRGEQMQNAKFYCESQMVFLLCCRVYHHFVHINSCFRCWSPANWVPTCFKLLMDSSLSCRGVQK